MRAIKSAKYCQVQLFHSLSTLENIWVNQQSGIDTPSCGTTRLQPCASLKAGVEKKIWYNVPRW